MIGLLRQKRGTAPLGRTIVIESSLAPQAKARPRLAIVGGRPQIYTPQKTARYEDGLRLLAQKAMAGQPPTDEPVLLQALVRVPIPPSWSKGRKQAAHYGEIRPISRPDLDNFLKSIADALNRIVFWDDAQIVEIRALKYYDRDPGLRLTIQPFGPSTSSGLAQADPITIDDKLGLET
jgi:Holliday junction resolvase RusA-like endonuclease